MSLSPARIACSIALAVALGAGLWGRFHGLGQRQLAVDEYYFVRSVECILEHGLPALPSGGYYVRGLLVQYLAAGAALLFGAGGFAWRLPAALASLGCAALAWTYGRRWIGSLPALAVAVVLLLSSWEVEFARFARMYAPFQLATLVALVAASAAFVDRRRGWLYLPHLACAVAALIHEMAVLLAPLLLLPLLDRESPARTSRVRAALFAAAGAATVGFAYTAGQVDLRNLGVSDRLPAGFEPTRRAMLRLPDLPYSGLEAQTYLVLLLAALGGVALVFLARARGRGRAGEAELLGAVAAVAAAAHALSVAAPCLAVLVLRYRWRETSRLGRALAVAALVLSAGWLLRSWRTGAGLGSIAATLFGWPDFYGALARPWLRELPLIALACAAAAAWVLYLRSREPWGWFAAGPLLPLAWVAICIGLLQSHYRSTRYSFFVYPLIWIVIALGAVELLRRLGERTGWRLHEGAAAAAIVLAVFAASGDFDPRHIALVAGPEASYRIGRFAGRERTWYPRPDFRSAAEAVAAGAGPRDGIIVVDAPPVSYYLERDHAIYLAHSELRFVHVSREAGTRELWSDRRLLGTPAELWDYAARHDALWLVGPAEDPLARWLAERSAHVQRVASGVDGRIEVLRIDGLRRPGPGTGAGVDSAQGGDAG